MTAVGALLIEVDSDIEVASLWGVAALCARGTCVNRLAGFGMAHVVLGLGETIDCAASAWPGMLCSHGFHPAENSAMPSTSFLVSVSVVALAEIGDKTQLLSLVLAAKYRKPVPVAFGVLVAALVNHACAGGVGTLLAQYLNPNVLDWAVVLSFIGMAFWILVPDKPDDGGDVALKHPMGVLTTTIVTFFLAEMGDKTQVATVALAARFHDFWGVVGGTTLGMMLANLPVIYLGNRFAHRLPAGAVHTIAAVIFLVLGGWALHTAITGS